VRVVDTVLEVLLHVLATMLFYIVELFVVLSSPNIECVSGILLFYYVERFCNFVVRSHTLMIGV